MKPGKKINPRHIARWLRYLCYVLVIYFLWNFLSDFSFVRLQNGDDSVVGISGHRSLVLKKCDEDSAPLEKGTAVVFVMADSEGKPFKRAARIAGVPGDEVAAGGRFVEINGEPTVYPASEARLIEGVVPEGMFLLLNDNPFSKFPDSRRTGYIPREVILGRVLSETPF